MAKVISHWSALVDDFNTSGKEFYEAVEKAIVGREVPDTVADSIVYKEGGLLSGKREYLRVQRERIVFDLCAAPYGTGFFFSWWVAKERPPGGWIWLGGFLLATFLWLKLFVDATTSSMAADFMGTGGGGSPGFVLLTGPLVFLCFLAAVRYADIVEEERIIGIPFIGWLYIKLFDPFTYYRLDSAIMFQESVSRAVNDVINGLLAEQGLQALSDEQLKPTIRDLVR